MSERDSHPAGTPSWVDLGSPDIDASASFYSSIFGWDIAAADPDPAYGGYRMAMLKGRPVAGLGPAQSEDAPPWWTTYVTVDDTDATAKVVEEAGGNVLAAPMDVGPFGRMAVFTDPAGAVFSVWQPRQHIGSGLVNEPGSLTWNELMTRDIDGAKSFYGNVFGWLYDDVDMGEDVTYTVFKLNAEDQGIAGGMPMIGDMWPAELPDHWMVYFEVEDCDATAAKVTELGGTVSHPPTDIPNVGRFAVCNGPHGEVFSIIKSAQPAG